jgi:hypothetical protein
MLQKILDDLSDLRLGATKHPLFFRKWSRSDLHIFMEHHAIAVWDFMSLLKSLQHSIISTSTPWMPPANPAVARAINNLVLGEETDHIPEINFTGSHFELYLSAMDEVGASTDAVEKFLAKLSMGYPFAYSLTESSIPAAAQRFTRNTFMICQRSPHEMAAAFFYGREEIIPSVFTEVLKNIEDRDVKYFRAYLDRHIEVDSGEHLDFSKTILNDLCGNSSRRWSEAFECAASALAARRRLWDDVLQAMEQRGALSAEASFVQSFPAGYFTQKYP